MDTQSYISVKEAASRLGVSKTTVFSLIKSGQLRAYRFGKLFRISETDFISYVEASRFLEPFPVDMGEENCSNE